MKPNCLNLAKKTMKRNLIILGIATSPLASHAATITFESPTYAAGALAVVHGSTSNSPFNGLNGWSRSTSDGGASIISTVTSGSYTGGQALQNSGANATYIGGNRSSGLIAYTGFNTITFDAQFASGFTVGFLGDQDNDGLFDQTEAGAGFGSSGTGFNCRDDSFGSSASNLGAGTAGSWYRISVVIGESISGSRAITMSAINLTTGGTTIDINGATAGTARSFSMTDANFGVAPEDAVGVYVRTSGASALDNLTFTAVPEPAAALLGGLGMLTLLRRRRN